MTFFPMLAATLPTKPLIIYHTRKYVVMSIQLIGNIFRNSMLQHWWFFELQVQFFRFPGKFNNWGRPIKTHHITEKLVHIVKKNKVHQNLFQFFIANQNWLCYQLIQFWREICKIALKVQRATDVGEYYFQKCHR